MAQSSNRDVAVFWDLESCSMPRTGNVSAIVQRIKGAASQYGRVAHIAAYLAHEMKSSEQAAKRDRDWGRSWSKLPSFNVQVEYCRRFGQSEVVDRRIIADVPYYLKAHPATQVIVLITDDADFINLGERLKRYNMRVVVISNRQSFEKYRQFFDDVYHWKRDILGQAGIPWPALPHDSTISRYPPLRGIVNQIWDEDAGDGDDDDAADEGGIEGWTDIMGRSTGDDMEDTMTYPIKHSASALVLSSVESSRGSDSDSSDSDMETSKPDAATFPKPSSRRPPDRTSESSCSESEMKQPARGDRDVGISRRTTPSSDTEPCPKKVLRSTKPNHTRERDSSSDVDMDWDPDSDSDSPGNVQSTRTEQLEVNANDPASPGSRKERKSNACRRGTLGNWKNRRPAQSPSDSDSGWSDSELQVAKIVRSESGYSSAYSPASRLQTAKPYCSEDEDDVGAYMEADIEMVPLEGRPDNSLPLEPEGSRKPPPHLESRTVGEAGALHSLHHLSPVPSTTVPSSSPANNTRGKFSLGRIASFLRSRPSDPEDSDDEWGRMHTTTRWEWNCFGNLGVSLGSKRKASEALESASTSIPGPITKKPRVCVAGSSSKYAGEE